MSCGYLPEECGRPIAHWRVCLCFPVTTYHIAYLCNRNYQRRNCSLCIMTIDTDCSASIAGKESYQRWFSSVLPDKFNESVSAHLPIRVVMDSKGTVVTSKTATTFCVLLVSVGKCEAGSRVKWRSDLYQRWVWGWLQFLLSFFHNQEITMYS